jgi:hypothetical protein
MFEKGKSPGSESPLGGSRRGSSISPTSPSSGASQFLQLPQKPAADELLQARTHLRAVSSKDGSLSGGSSSLEGLLEEVQQYDSDDSEGEASVVHM